MPVASGNINGHKVNVLRDTGCSGVVVRKDLVEPGQFTKYHVICVTVDNRSIQAPVAKHKVCSPYYTGWVTAACIDTPTTTL